MPKKNKKGGLTETILVTGGAGFIGSNFLNAVVVRYPKTLFVNVDCLTYAANPANILVHNAPNYRFEKADIKNRAALKKIFKKYEPTGVIHFAAESHVDRSIKDATVFLETNVLGTGNLLAFSREFGIRRFLQISTDEVYGALPDRRGKFTEESPLAPRNPYSASKVAGDVLAFSYHQTFGLDVVITRSSNNYGPRQDTSKVIPLFMTRLLGGKKVPLYGRGAQIRDWLFVEDNVAAIDLVFRKGRAGEVYNIGGECELTNLALTKKLLALLGRDKSSVESVPDRLGHDFRYALDISKIKKELGWKPKTGFDEGLRKTFEFYRSKALS